MHNPTQLTITMKTKIQLPSIRELQRALTSIKRDICDDYIQDDDDSPSIQVTLACDETGYALQTGDNSYSGSAYHYKHWGVSSVYKNSNCDAIARDLIDQCKDLAA